MVSPGPRLRQRGFRVGALSPCAYCLPQGIFPAGMQCWVTTTRLSTEDVPMCAKQFKCFISFALPNGLWVYLTILFISGTQALSGLMPHP